MENLISILRQVVDLGCTGIKISFEDEGALLNEHIIMSHLTCSLGIDLAIKIGGCEAKRDIVDCINLNCTSVVAPMVESRFALNKYINSCKQYNVKQKLGFNLETIQAYNNLNQLKEEFASIDYVTFGRVDFVSSLNKDRSYVDNEEMYGYVSDVFRTVKAYNKKCYMGGAISVASEEFINKLIAEKLLDKYETRYIIFDATKVSDFKKCIYYANLFEVAWLKYIREMYLMSADKDKKRIEMIEERMSINKQ
jgi:4-hydroxy-2-oxoheptanedioate aldolase